MPTTHFLTFHPHSFKKLQSCPERFLQVLSRFDFLTLYHIFVSNFSQFFVVSRQIPTRLLQNVSKIESITMHRYQVDTYFVLINWIGAMSSLFVLTISNLRYCPFRNGCQGTVLYISTVLGICKHSLVKHVRRCLFALAVLFGCGIFVSFAKANARFYLPRQKTTAINDRNYLFIRIALQLCLLTRSNSTRTLFCNSLNIKYKLIHLGKQ